jgi:hypothetical protein
MRSSHSRFISRIVLFALLSDGIAAPALAAAVGPGGGGGGAPGGGGGAPAGGGAAPAEALRPVELTGSRRGAGGCTTFSFGKAMSTRFIAQNGLAPNGQPCSDFGN